MKTLVIIFPILLLSQTFDRDLNPFTVIISGDTLSAPFIGGFNKPNPRFLDWNEDGLIDLFIRDEDGFLQHFKNVGSTSDPRFQLETKTFQGLNVGMWFSFMDFENDDDPDLLCQTSGSSNISAYENVSGEFQLRTESLLDTLGVPVYGSTANIPTLADIDGDEQADFFVGDQMGLGKVIYYSNVGTSNGLPLFKYMTNYFQHIRIVWVPSGINSRHGANSLEFFDIDADNTNDLFWGDLYQPGLFFLKNIGNSQEPDIPDSLIVYEYPEEYPVLTAGFNAPRFADIDNDGDSELFLGVQSGAYGIDDIDNFWYYENKGTSTVPQFTFETKNFIPTLDIFTKSVPTFIDMDNDNDLDLFIGNEFVPYTSGGRIYCFENTGTNLDPVLVLYDSSIFGDNIGNNLAPTFADIDGDGDQDGFVGDWNGYLYYSENTGSPSVPNFEKFEDMHQDSVYFLYPETTIDISGYSSPFFADIDQRAEFFTNTVEFTGVLRVGIFNNLEFFLVGVIAGVHTYLFYNFGGNFGGVWGVVDIGD